MIDARCGGMKYLMVLGDENMLRVADGLEDVMIEYENESQIQERPPTLYISRIKDSHPHAHIMHIGVA